MNVIINLSLSYEEALQLAKHLPENLSLEGTDYPSDDEVKCFELLYDVKQKLCDILNIEVYDI